jgi:hypothetical protein
MSIKKDLLPEGFYKIKFLWKYGGDDEIAVAQL